MKDFADLEEGFKRHSNTYMRSKRRILSGNMFCQVLVLISILTLLPSAAGAQSYIGIDFRPPPRLDMDHLDRFSDLGIDSYGFEFLIWNVVEPNEPVDGVHIYDWSYPDQMIQEIEQRGRHSLITLRIPSSWANREGFDYGEFGYRPTIPPRKEYWDDLAAFIQAVVERYDGDGYEDMPGLKYQHLLYQFGSEPELHWKGTPEEYVNILSIFYDSVKQANPDVSVIAMGFNFSDLFDHNPTVDEVNSLPMSPGKQKRKEFVERVLLNSAHFDIVGTNCNYNYTGLQARMRWIASMTNKPVWCSDMATGYMFNRHQFQEPLYAPKAEYIIEDRLRNGGENFQQIIEWASMEQAKYVFKKIISAAASGYKRQYMQWPIETLNPLHGWVMTGLLEDNVPERGITPGTPRPVYYALKLFQEKVGDFDSVEDMNPLPAGIDPYSWTWVIKFTKGSRNIYVLWADSGSDAIDLSPYIPTDYIRLTPIVIKLDENNDPIYPAERIVPSHNIQFGTIPVFAEEEAGGAAPQ